MDTDSWKYLKLLQVRAVLRATRERREKNAFRSSEEAQVER
jgi:hypothetical protein